MNHECFSKAFEKADNQLNDRYTRSVIEASIEANLKPSDIYGQHSLYICIEELAELIQEISKQLRNPSKRYEVNVGTLEEMADAQIALLYLKTIFEVHDEEFNKAINVKLDRVSEKLKKEGVYR